MLLQKERLNDLLMAAAKYARVYVPVVAPSSSYDEGNSDAPSAASALSRFELYQAHTKAAFDLVNTSMPPKDMLFPQTQKMYRYGFDAEGNAYIDAVHDADDVVIFGLRPCDARSIECMDDVFLTKGYGDVFYEARRDRLTTVVIGCSQVAETCFCDSMGLDPSTAPSADILLNALADDSAYVVTAQTEKGTAFVEAQKSFFDEASTAALDEASTAALAPSVECSLKVDATGIKEKLDLMFEHPLWEQISKKCLTCGTCTYVCPTCHCFDISQENRMKDGERFRCWDSCMFSNYTEMAGNHNPRPDKLSRVRQRFMHKLCFFEDRYGKSLCVGCGRCVEKCPVALDITLLIENIQAASLPTEQPEKEGAAHVD